MAALSWQTGVNMREFAYYGTSAAQHTSAGLRQQQINELTTFGIKRVRFYGSHADFTTDQCIQQVRGTLDLLHAADLQAIICLSDSLDDGGKRFYVKGDEAFHRMGTPQGHLHKDYWTSSAYNQNYLPHVRAMVSAFRTHPAVLMWELGNEYALHPQPATEAEAQAFLLFVQIASAAVKNIAPHHFVSVGLINTRQVSRSMIAGEDEPTHLKHVKSFARQMHGLATVDAVSIHYYREKNGNLPEKRYCDLDIDVANGLTKPFYAGELGAECTTGDRPGFYRTEIEELKSNNAASALLWGFSAATVDLDIADLYAFARPNNNNPHFGDFDGIKAVMQSFQGAPIAGVEHASLVVGDVMVEGVLNEDEREDRLKLVAEDPLDTAKVRPGDTVNKWWQVRNAGNTTWDGYELVFSEGNQLGGPTRIRLPDLKPTEIAKIPLTLTAPAAPGVYRGTWTPRTKDGTAFRTVIWVQFEVRASVMGASGSEDLVADKSMLKLVDEFPLDGVFIKPGERFTKWWEVRNAGTTNWSEGFALVRDGADGLTGPARLSLNALVPNEVQRVQLDLTAPTVVGGYKLLYRPHDSSDTGFKSAIWCQIQVGEPPADDDLNTSGALFPCPVKRGADPCRISNDFQEEDGDNDNKKHHGIDLSVPVGRVVRAAARGVVIYSRLCDVCGDPTKPNFKSQGVTSDEDRKVAFAKEIPWNWGFGNLVIVRYSWEVLPNVTKEMMRTFSNASAATFDNGCIFVIYGHLSEISVSKDGIVSNGMQIGLSGNTGNSTGPHLHLEVRASPEPKATSWSSKFTKRINPKLMFADVVPQ